MGTAIVSQFIDNIKRVLNLLVLLVLCLQSFSVGVEIRFAFTVMLTKRARLYIVRCIEWAHFHRWAHVFGTAFGDMVRQATLRQPVRRIERTNHPIAAHFCNDFLITSCNWLRKVSHDVMHAVLTWFSIFASPKFQFDLSSISHQVLLFKYHLFRVRCERMFKEICFDRRVYDCLILWQYAVEWNWHFDGPIGRKSTDSSFRVKRWPYFIPFSINYKLIEIFFRALDWK